MVSNSCLTYAASVRAEVQCLNSAQSVSFLGNLGRLRPKLSQSLGPNWTEFELVWLHFGQIRPVLRRTRPELARLVDFGPNSLDADIWPMSGQVLVDSKSNLAAIDRVPPQIGPVPGLFQERRGLKRPSATAWKDHVVNQETLTPSEQHKPPGSSGLLKRAPAR